MPASMYLDEASVTGTETALLAAATIDGVTEIRHAATEPHVVEVCKFLQSMGIGITGAGSSTIRVEGTRRPRGVTHQLNGDYIEAGSWAVVAAVTGGEIEVRGARAEDVEGIAFVLKRMNVACTFEDGLMTIQKSKPVAAGRITTGPVAELPERFRQPGHRAGHAGRRPHADSRLDVRAASLRARAAQRHARRSVPVRSAPDHRDRPEQAEGHASSTAAICVREWR